MVHSFLGLIPVGHLVGHLTFVLLAVFFLLLPVLGKLGFLFLCLFACTFCLCLFTLEIFLLPLSNPRPNSPIITRLIGSSGEGFVSLVACAPFFTFLGLLGGFTLGWVLNHPSGKEILLDISN